MAKNVEKTETEDFESEFEKDAKLNNKVSVTSVLDLKGVELI